VNAEQERITRICQAGRERARSMYTRERLHELHAEKDRLVRRGLIVLMSRDYAAVDAWRSEYASLTSIIRDYEHHVAA